MISLTLACALASAFLSTARADEATNSSSIEESSANPVFIRDVASKVNLFIGTTAGGHVFPGATVPHGMVKVGMDTDSGGNHAGYDADPQFRVTGFSQLHDDGTGGSIPLSNFKIWPHASCGQNDRFEDCPTSLDSRKASRKLKADGKPDDYAEPGYFASNLSTGVRVELTSTRRTALHRYTFPEGTANPRIVVDLTNDGQRSSADPAFELDPKTARVIGGASFVGSFGPGRYRAYMCADFKGEGFNLGAPTEFGVFQGDRALKQTQAINQLYYHNRAELGGLLTFAPNKAGPTSILVRVGVSLISQAQACRNAEQEIGDFNFKRVQSDSRAQWNELLGRIQVDPKDVKPDTVELFYSSLYRTHISPADYTGENPLWKSTEPYFDSFYCNWDAYRTLYPLLSFHDPATFARIIRGMIDIQQHEGKFRWLPECRGATVQHFIQGGSNADPILGEFFVKFHKHAQALGVSSRALYRALLADAENQPPNFDLQGRQANVWKTLGYIPHDVWEKGGTNTKQVSRALEYAFDDFTISQVARILNLKEDAAKYANRSRNFEKVWNPDLVFPDNDNIKGMMQPRLANGQWGFTDPRHCSAHDPDRATCFLNAENSDGFYEASPMVYSQYVPHDTARLIELQGGKEKFISRLDFMFENNYFDSTNEPSQQIPYMYHYADRPGKSTQRSRQVIAQFYSTAVNGLPGNDDSGAMGSYVVFNLAGLYPLPGTRQVLLSSSYFRSISFKNPVLKTTTTIKSNGFQGNPDDGTGGHVFVQSVKVNGKPWKSNCFLDWDIFEKGGLVELELSDNIENGCGELPPSLSTGGYNHA